MTYPDGHDEPVTFTDKRRIDPETGEVREGVASGPAPVGRVRRCPRRTTRSPNSPPICSGSRRTSPTTASARCATRKPAGDRAKAVVVSQLLPVLDDLDRARSHGDLDSGPLKSVADKLVAVLGGFGLTAFGAEGEEFDPSLHEAVQHGATAPTR